MRARETGWSTKSNALYEIMKQLDRMMGIAWKWTQGDFHQSISTTTTTTSISETTTTTTTSLIIGERIALVGDSITNQNDGSWELASTYNISSAGFFNWGRAFTRKQSVLKYQYSVSGGSTDEILAGISAITDHNDIDIVNLMAGINDIGDGKAIEDILTDYESLVDALSAYHVLALTVLPRWTETELTTSKRNTLNSFILNLPNVKSNLTAVDVSTSITNPSLGNIISEDLTIDGVHLSHVGAMLVGKTLSSALAQMLPDVDEVFPTEEDVLCVLPNASMSTAWNTVACSVVYSDSVEYPGRKKAVITPSSATTAEIKHPEINISTGRFAEGDIIQGMVDVEWDVSAFNASAGNFHPRLALAPRYSAGTFDTSSYSLSTSSGNYVELANALFTGRMILKTVPYTVKTGINRIYFNMNVYGIVTGTMTVHRIVLKKVG